MTNGRGGSADISVTPTRPQSAWLQPAYSMPDKDAVRREARYRRAAIAPGDRNTRAAALADRVFESMAVRPGTVVSGYSAIRDEADPSGLMQRLHEAGALCALPAVDGAGLPLQFRRWQPGDVLEPAAFGVSEPRATSPVVRPDIVLTPLLAFDRFGGRLGYGAGFFDRTLAALRRSGAVLAIGLAFCEQEFARIPVTVDDQPLDWVITEVEAIRCAGAERASRCD